jgi:hypothetical protein
MSDTQERKWRAYKKALYIEEFTENILPRYTSADAVDPTDSNTTWSKEGKWGIWSIITSDTPAQSGKYYPGYCAVDSDTNSYYKSRYMKSGAHSTLDIVLPEGVSICPKEIKIIHTYNGSTSYGGSYFYGWRADTGEKELLKTIPAARPGPTTTTYTNADETKFYTRFQISLCINNSAANYTRVYDVKINSGIIKKG